jgi:protein O-GlcNAc transferase
MSPSSSLASLGDAVRKAVKLAKAKQISQLRRFCEKACRRYPRSMELLKLHHLACRELEDDLAAIKVALNYLQTNSPAKEVYRMVESVLPLITQRDSEMLHLLSQLDTLPGRELEVYALVNCKNSLDACRVFKVLQARWAEQTNLTYAKFADLLFAAELYEAADPVYWTALERAPLDPLRLRHVIENTLKLTETDYPEKISEAQELSALFLQQRPQEPEAWFAAGLVWRAASRADRAYSYFERYFECYPDHPFRSAHVFDVAYVEGLPLAELYQLRCDWADVTARLTHVSAEALQNSLEPTRRIRVGYVSPDFGLHPVGYFARTVLLQHDPEQVEVFLYSQRDRASEDDVLSQEFRAWCGDSHWRWTKQDSAKRLLARIRDDRIDVLVDLAGHSKGNRLDAFCNRAAPVQVSWLGYPATTGVREMDYRFSDAIIEPLESSQAWSSEEIWHLPQGFHALNMPADLPDPSPPPCLENGYITFGSFNNINKLGPKTCALWARVLRSIPQARLLLKHISMEIFANRESIRSFFVMNGVDPARISFKGVTQRREDHFVNYELMDVALDPVGYNGTTTTCEALYMGVPVLTCLGDRHVSRVSASLLHRMGMDGWVAQSEDQFVRIAQAASAQPQALAQRRAKMRADYENSPLNDGAGLARDMEVGYQAMWRKHCGENTSKI